MRDLSKKSILRAWVMVSLLFIPWLCVVGQIQYNLHSKKGHYYFTAIINEISEQEIFVESGIAGMLINEILFEQLCKDKDYKEVEYENHIFHTDFAEYKILKVLNGNVKIGDLNYFGNIFIVPNYEKIAVPIHRVRNGVDSVANIIKLDFRNKTLSLVKRNEHDLNEMRRFKIIKFIPMPIIQTSITLTDQYGKHNTLLGNFVFDLGNGSPLFFFKKNIAEFIKTNNIKVYPAKDRNGNVIGSGIFAYNCLIGQEKLTNVSIGITNKLWRADGVLGCIGPSMFNNGIVFIDPIYDELLY